MSQQCALAAKRANHMASQSKEVVLLAYLALLWPHLEYCVQFWTLQYKNGVKILECVQRRAAKLITVREGTERLRTLWLSSLEERRLRGNLVALCIFPRRGSGEGSAGLLFVVTKDVP